MKKDIQKLLITLKKEVCNVNYEKQKAGGYTELSNYYYGCLSKLLFCISELEKILKEKSNEKTTG